MHSTLLVGDRGRIVTHPAGAAQVIDGVGGFTNEFVERLVIDQGGAGAALGASEVVEGGLRVNLAYQTYTRT